jgi:hypothetical protein
VARSARRRVQQVGLTLHELCAKSAAAAGVDDVQRALAVSGAKVSGDVPEWVRDLVDADVARLEAVAEAERIEAAGQAYRESAHGPRLVDGSMAVTSSAMSRWVARLPIPVEATTARPYPSEAEGLRTIDEAEAVWRVECARIRGRNQFLTPELHMPIPTFEEWRAQQSPGLTLASALAALCYAAHDRESGLVSLAVVDG